VGVRPAARSLKGSSSCGIAVDADGCVRGYVYMRPRAVRLTMRYVYLAQLTVLRPTSATLGAVEGQVYRTRSSMLSVEVRR
jgi:hypothetical protein